MSSRNKAQRSSGYLNCIPEFDLTNIIKSIKYKYQVQLSILKKNEKALIEL